MKRKLLALGVALSSLAAFAEGEPATLESQLGTAATSAITSLTTTIGPILVGAFGIAVGFVVYKLVKRAINKA